jgi:hypothetical protein
VRREDVDVARVGMLMAGADEGSQPRQVSAS